MTKDRYPEADQAVFAIIRQLKQRRTALGLTQDEIALKLGTQQSAISEWETGTSGITLKGAVRYADLLGLQVVLSSAEFPGGVQ